MTYRRRKNLRRSQFAEPAKRKYPIEDKPHARNALARVSQHGTRSEKALVRRAVHQRYPSIKCSSCGYASVHKHGKHGCCGDPMCHHRLTIEHDYAGEHGVPLHEGPDLFDEGTHPMRMGFGGGIRESDWSL